ncbi:MAG: hypothetical protein AB7P40_05670 [Chloroflexota bacterium]
MKSDCLHRVVAVALVAFGVTAASSLLVGTGPVAAQDSTPVPRSPAFLPPPPLADSGDEDAQFDPTVPRPPAAGAVVYQQPLTDTAIFRAGRCQTDQAGGGPVGEGFRISVAGRCGEASETAEVALAGRGISLGDGELALEFKVVAGSDRASVSVYARNQSGKLIGVTVRPAAGAASLFSLSDGTITELTSRTDISSLVKPSDWNRLGLRVMGAEMWLLVNGEAILHAADVIQEAGGVGIRVLREGSPDDDREIAVVFRNLVLSTVTDAEPSRGPTFP